MKKVWFFFIDCSKDRWVWYRVLKYLGSFLFALYFAAFRVEISESTRNFIVLPFSPDKSISDYNVDVHTVVYLVLTLIFLILLVFFYGGVNIRGNKKFELAIEEVRSSIYRAPNVNIFSAYPVICNSVINHLRNAKLSIKEKNEKKQDFETMFQDVLSDICGFASSFTNQKKELFSADFMIFFDILKDKDIISKLEMNPSYLNNHIKPEFLQGVLATIDDLSYPHPMEHGRKVIIPIINERKKKLAQVTGPASAFLQGECIKEDTSNIFGQFEKVNGMEEFKNDIEDYYQKNTDFFKSFASFSLTYKDGTRGFHEKIGVGVLNIYFKNENILGTDKKFHNTFSAFILPIAYTMAHELRKYIDIHKKDIII
ncbi:MAG: hypothetical protein WD398_10515 [Cyclobacteriaceae bacterium]